ncbi:hypothetical protein BC826DRAFT_1038817 [Russula brevipes]|nr:hypothetical protein BC826DRAFT_1038817 [Russula brevipes]
MKVMLRSIWPNVNNIRYRAVNSTPASSGINTRVFMYFLLSLSPFRKSSSPCNKSVRCLPSAFPMFPVRIVIDVRSVTWHLFTLKPQAP